MIWIIRFVIYLTRDFIRRDILALHTLERYVHAGQVQVLEAFVLELTCGAGGGGGGGPLLNPSLSNCSEIIPLSLSLSLSLSKRKIFFFVSERETVNDSRSRMCVCM